MSIDEMLTQLQADCTHISSTKTTFTHPLFQQLVEMGDPVKERIVEKIRGAEQHELSWIWLYILVKITGGNPIEIESRGRIGLATADWIRWYDKRD